MQPPKTIDELLFLAEKGRLIESARLSTIRQKIAESPGTVSDATQLADLLVRQHVLSRFQADQLLQGRSKGFWVKRYKIIDQVGIGGMARVFLAEHSIMRRKVALKILPTAKCSDPASLARFLREARAIAAINHPNVIRAYDIDQDADFYYIVLEFAEGLTVAQYVEEHGPVPYPQACDYVYQAASGLEHLLSCGIIHRDIKPSNIIIEHSGRVKLVDLGLAVFFEEKELDPLTIKYDQNVLGTVDYLAPEQAIDSHNVDGRADIYSLGASFCFMLTGKPPFPKGTAAEKLHAHQTEPFKTVRDRAPDVPRDLDAILCKMLAKKPQDRFATMAELRSALRRFLPINSVSALLSGTFAMLNGHSVSRSSEDTPVPRSQPTPVIKPSAPDPTPTPPRSAPPRPAQQQPLQTLTTPAPVKESEPEVILEADEEEEDNSASRRKIILLAIAGVSILLAAAIVGYFYLL